MLALKLLCEIRLDKDDLRSAIEISLKPVKPPSRPPSGKTRAGGSSTRGRPELAPEPSMDIRHEPLGEDDAGITYWYLDLGPDGHTSPAGPALLMIITHIQDACKPENVHPAFAAQYCLAFLPSSGKPIAL